MTGFSPAALGYFEARAIDPGLAAACGVREVREHVVFPCCAPDGESFHRLRSLHQDGPAKVEQPKGHPLTLWWPLGRPPVARAVLVCEGESDALAVLEPLADSRFASLAVVAVPGTGFPVGRLVEQLTEVAVRHAYLAFDGDDAGRRYSEKTAQSLREAGVRPITVELEDGTDLAETLAQVEDRAAWIEQALADAETVADSEPDEQGGSSWRPVDLAAVIRNGNLDSPPAFLARTDGVLLLYPGRVHVVAGEPESAKGWIALDAVVERLRAGETVFYFDFEDTAATATSRLMALGVEAAAISSQFFYFSPDEPLDDEAWLALGPALATGPSLAVLDGVTEAMTLHGLNPLDNVDVAKWLGLLPRPLAKTGAAVLQVDHVGRDQDARGRFALGAQQKLAGVTASYGVEVIEPFGRGREGRARVMVHKDRPGHVRQHADGAGRIAEFRLSSPPDGEPVSAELRPPTASTEDAREPFRPTGQMERVSRAVEDSPGLTKNSIRAAVTGKNDYIDLALDRLIAEDYMRVQRDGQASRHYPVRPFREWAEEADEA